MTRIALVDDHSIILEGLQLMLGDEPDIDIVGSYRNGGELLSALDQQGSLELILLDINLPDTNGVELCRMIKRDYPSTQIIGLSMVSDLSLIKLMFKNGAVGYLHKNAGKEEILLAIERVKEGKRYLSDEVSALMMGESPPAKLGDSRSPFPRLSRREKEVLRLIVDEHTTQEIADKLFISFGTVETHRRNILGKLGARNTAGLVRVAMEYELLD